jgi:hypothetical protein
MQLPMDAIVGDDAGCLLMNNQAFTSDPHAPWRPKDYVPNQEVCA